MATEVVNGTKVISEVDFEIDDVPVDPTTVTFKVRKPDGTITSYVYNDPGSIVVKDSAGNYMAEVLVNMEGYWSFRWQGEGVVDIADEVEILCVDSQFTTV